MGSFAASGAASILAIGRRPSGFSGVEDILVPDLSPERIEVALGHRRFDGLVHLAASGVHPADRDIETLVRMNSLLPAQLVMLAAQCGARAVVIAGTSAEYRGPEANERLNEQAPLEAARLYGATKAAGGILALAHGAAYGIPVGHARLFNVYGPGEAPHRLLPSLVRNLRVGMRVPLSAGTQVRDFVYVDDACAGLWAVLQALAEGRMPSGAYNIATGEGCSVADFARLTARAMGVSEHLLAFGDISMRPDDLPYMVGDSAALKRACGWQPARTVERGIAMAIAEM